MFQCPYCGVGCGLRIDEKGRVKGDANHPANRGDLCKKPLYLPKVNPIGRIEKPLYRERKDEAFRGISWSEAYRILADRIRSIEREEFYLYLSGQLLTEDIYVANKFVKGFIGTNNVDANSRLCMASAVTAYKLVFGSDGVPCTYEDIDNGDAFLFIGSNAAITHPVLFKRVLKRRREDRNVLIITIDPVETQTAQKSDIHIPIRAGTDTIFLNAVLGVLYKEGWIDREFVEKHTRGFEEALAQAMKIPLSRAASLCGVKEEDIYLIAGLFARSRKLLSFWCQGLNQSVNGVMKNVALLNLHLATRRLNERGCPFSLTGQPNAMGGREVGYLTNGLPGYRGVRDDEDREFMERFWKVERIDPRPGPTITEAIDLILEGKIKLLWVVCTNPAVSLPNLHKVRRALGKVFLVVQDAYWNDTCELANLILPASVVGEKEGTMTGSDRTVTLCKRVSEPYMESKPDWLIFTELARFMGGEELFPYESPEEVFEEFKRATKGRVCDMSHLSYGNLPARWGRRWLYEDLSFSTEDRKARFIPAKFHRAREKGFILLTGRLKNQWHTMTRTGKSEELLKGEMPPFVVMHPQDGATLGIEEGDEVIIRSELGSTRRVVRFGNIRRGHLFAPFGYPWELGEPINCVVRDRTDPLSKEPDLKYTGVSISLTHRSPRYNLTCGEDTFGETHKGESGRRRKAVSGRGD